MSDMLGILVTNEKFKAAATATATAALELGKKVEIFLTDRGSRLSLDKEFLTLLPRGASISICGHSAQENGIEKDKINSLGVRYATQFENAVIAQESKRYLVF